LTDIFTIAGPAGTALAQALTSTLSVLTKTMNMLDRWNPRLESLLIPVRGMTDSRSVSSVSSALGLIGGVREVQVSLQRGEAQIVFDPAKADPGQFYTAIRAVGFKSQSQSIGDARVAA
jgi:copper chaperone CopZ